MDAMLVLPRSMLAFRSLMGWLLILLLWPRLWLLLSPPALEAATSRLA